ncbi:PQQ-dependent sugar dehydrogenase [Isoptericola sp. S6320L]|uniref:PQQ-dependent sugar dehydrogenase n=1 Tax=Isoptericola sp. S6320L TaxID=2926411 RepID=UPI001FF17B73|nr:PQQ-dependent sugar dehydrogenase [Isoptericola sp. S6320L]MCK0116725.1 PQQ-dependent sugar dehydrogenase [Isoptericola sp. S6320L]
MVNSRRSRVSVALATMLALAVPAAAAAHDGVDHGAEPGAEAALDWSNYEKVLLSKNTGEPIGMAVMPDGSVLHTARDGAVRHTDPSTGVTEVVNTVDVYANSEDGMQGIALAPDFAESGWVYLYYAPRVMEGDDYPTTTPSGSAPNSLPEGEDESYWDQWKGYNQLSRFQWDAEAHALDLSTEQKILQVEVQRGQCCHVGGDIDFDAEGNVYLSTGDNTPASTPGANGFTPINNAPGMNPGFDARRGAGSTNDLRGAILRVHVEEDGSYTIPEGNLFEPGTEGTRPELFVMGLRNPFRIDVDDVTGAVSWGDYGPDSGVASDERGPMGYVEWQSTTTPLNGGWPYCHGPNTNYNEWDYATATPGEWFDCEAGAENSSTWNTGLDVLPPATAPQVYYGDNPGDQPFDEFVEFDAQGGQGPMGGPTFHHDPEGPDSQWPEYWDGKAFMYEFSQDYIAGLTIPDQDGPVTHVEHVLPNDALTDNVQAITDGPIDMEFGPDGSLYVLDYGNGFFRQNPEAGLYRIDYAEGNKSPTAQISADPVSSSQAPLTVTLDGSGSSDPEGAELTYEWDLDGDGTFDETGAQVTTTYTELGQYTVRLRVTDPAGRQGLTSQLVTVGNVAPTLSADHPADGGFFAWGDAVPYAFSTSDPEDGDETVCSELSWTFGLGHDTHAHPEVLGSGCSGAWATPADAPEHGATEKLYGVVVANYTDQGNGDIPPAQDEVSLLLNTFTQEAEHADVLEGVEVVADDSAGGLSKVTSFGAGDHLAWDPVNFTGIDGVDVRGAGTGTVELRWGAADAEPFATADLDAAGWSTVAADVAAFPEGTGELFVTSTGGVELDTLTFQGPGVTDVTAPEATVTLDPAEPTGDSGWYTGPVEVQLEATDDGQIGDGEVSTDGGQTWQSVRHPWFGTLQPFTLDEDGVHEVLYRVSDTGGNVSETGSVTVSVDATAPEVAVTGVADGDEPGSSQTVELGTEATDATSGVASSALTLDGETVEAGAIDLWTLDLGEHEVTATATDEAGNTTEVTVSFTVTTSFGDLAAHLERLQEGGELSSSEAARLSAFLGQAERHADAGRDRQAASALQRFVDATDEEVLVRDAEALVAQRG